MGLVTHTTRSHRSSIDPAYHTENAEFLDQFVIMLKEAGRFWCFKCNKESTSQRYPCECKIHLQTKVIIDSNHPNNSGLEAAAVTYNFLRDNNLLTRDVLAHYIVPVAAPAQNVPQAAGGETFSPIPPNATPEQSAAVPKTSQ